MKIQKIKSTPSEPAYYDELEEVREENAKLQDENERLIPYNRNPTRTVRRHDSRHRFILVGPRFSLVIA